MPYVILGIGSNEEPLKNIPRALELLNRHCDKMNLSPTYLSTALDPSEPDYINLVIKAKTDLGVEALLDVLKEIETLCGRRIGKFCMLDLDLLCYEGKVGNFAGVELPRVDLTDYAHVLLPLSELLPDQKHPVLNISYAELWRTNSTKLLEKQSLRPHSL